MNISDLPRRLKKRAKQYRKENANDHKNNSEHMKATLKTNRICCAFVWSDTPEGHEFWHKWFHKS